MKEFELEYKTEDGFIFSLEYETVLLFLKFLKEDIKIERTKENDTHIFRIKGNLLENSLNELLTCITVGKNLSYKIN